MSEGLEQALSDLHETLSSSSPRRAIDALRAAEDITNITEQLHNTEKDIGNRGKV